MNKNIILVLSLACFFMSGFIENGFGATADEDGCIYNIPERCIGMKAERRGDKLLVTVTEKCGHKIYVKTCVRKKKGSKYGESDCGVNSIRPYKSSVFSGFSAHSSNEYQVNWLGFSKPHSQWVCSHKIDDWSKDPW